MARARWTHTGATVSTFLRACGDLESRSCLPRGPARAPAEPRAARGVVIPIRRHCSPARHVVLSDCQAGWSDVAKVGMFLTDLGNFAAVNALYEEAVGSHRPARSTVGVAALPAGAGIEIECWVYLPTVA